MSVTRQTVVRVLIEILIYAVLVSIYLGIVLHFFVGWLQELFAKQRSVYAMVTIVLMIAQAFIFERLSTALVNWGRQRGTSSPK
jgi:Na+-driven multidrug efflux pump